MQPCWRQQDQLWHGEFPRASSTAPSVLLACNDFFLTDHEPLSTCLPLEQTLAAIHDMYPNGPLFKRIRGSVLSSQAACQFLTEWPSLRKAQEDALNGVQSISEQFTESATQSAFMALSLENRRMQSQLDVLARRTAPLSPSKHFTSAHARTAACSPSVSWSNLYSLLPPNPHTPVSDLTQAVVPSSDPRRPPPLPSLLSTMATQPPAATAPPQFNSEVATHSSPASSSSVTATPLSSPASHLTRLPTPAPGSSVTAAAASSPHQSVSVLIPFCIYHNAVKYTILPLSSGPSAPRTNLDLILPPAAAFAQPRDTSNHAQFPLFTLANCNWKSVLSMIKQPAEIWPTWCPKSLGSYSSLQEIWDAWDTGTTVDGVGHKPPLRLIELEWGDRKNERTGKGRQQTWRPKHNQKVSAPCCLPPNAACLTSHLGTPDVVPVHVLHLADIGTSC